MTTDRHLVPSFGTRFKRDLYDQLTSTAYELGVSRNSIVVAAVSDWLDHQAKAPDHS